MKLSRWSQWLTRESSTNSQWYFFSAGADRTAAWLLKKLFGVLKMLQGQGTSEEKNLDAAVEMSGEMFLSHCNPIGSHITVLWSRDSRGQ